MGPLAGIRVLDLSRVLAAPWAVQMLGDLGADVIKVEMPVTGDDSRIYGPAWLAGEDGKAGNNSSFYICANRNKRSVTVDFKTEAGKQVIRDLVRHCDVVVENFIAGAMTRAGLDYASLREINPRVIYCSLTGYGQDGPFASRPGYDAVFQAQSGLMSVTGLPDDAPGGGPMRLGPSLVDVSTGYNAAIGILAALVERDRSGRGQQIDVALLDVAVAMQSHLVQSFLMDGVMPERRGTLGNGGQPARVFHCKDGEIYISAGNQRQHEGLCSVLGIPEVAKDPRFATSPLRLDNREEWSAIVDPIIASWPKLALYEVMIAAKVPCSVINDYNEVFDDAQIRHRGLKITVPHPQAGERGLDLVANPLRFSETPIETYTAPPCLGQHTDEVLSELVGYDADKIDRLREQSAI